MVLNAQLQSTASSYRGPSLPLGTEQSVGMFQDRLLGSLKPTTELLFWYGVMVVDLKLVETVRDGRKRVGAREH